MPPGFSPFIPLFNTFHLGGRICGDKIPPRPLIHAHPKRTSLCGAITLIVMHVVGTPVIRSTSVHVGPAVTANRARVAHAVSLLKAGLERGGYKMWHARARRRGWPKTTKVDGDVLLM